jgi:hypothetical protein
MRIRTMLKAIRLGSLAIILALVAFAPLPAAAGGGGGGTCSNVCVTFCPEDPALYCTLIGCTAGGEVECKKESCGPIISSPRTLECGEPN